MKKKKGSLLRVSNALPDRPLRFLLASSPATTQPPALFAHNGAVIAANHIYIYIYMYI